MKPKTSAKKNRSESLSFPLRVAAIDIGSNAIRMAAADFAGQRDFTVLSCERASVRLGQGVFLTGRLTAEAVAAAVEAVRGMRRIIDRHGIRHVRAVATSAVRSAGNGRSFAARVKKELGVPLHVITGAEESRLIHLAIQSSIDMGNGEWLEVDLGGGSVEVSLVDATGILWNESHTMGAVRLLEELSGSGDTGGRFSRLLEEYVNTLRLPSRVTLRPVKGLIATGGNMEALVALSGVQEDRRGVSVLPLSRLRAVIERLARLSYRERVVDLGLREDRADVILPAALVYERLCRLSGRDEILAPHVGLREGVLLDLVGDLTAGRAGDLRHEQELRSAAVTLGRRFFFDEAHAAHVTEIGLTLFDRLAGAHRLRPDDRRILIAAGLLHDVGQYLSFRKHHKHSMYIISESELPGLAPEEILIAANVARYHRKTGPMPGHEPYAMLDKAGRVRVCKLAAILRVADSLDREHTQNVKLSAVSSKGGDVVLHVTAQGDLVLEMWALRKKSEFFTQVFGMKVQVDSPAGP